MQASRRILLLNFSAVQRSFLRNTSVHTASYAREEAQLKPWHEIPGPWKLPIIGQAHHFIPPGSLADFATCMVVLYEKFGPIVRLDGALGLPPMLFLFDPEACAFVLRGEVATPVRPGFMSLEYYRKKHNKPEEETRPTGSLADFATCMVVLYEKFGPIVRLDGALGLPPMLFLFDPEACAFVLRGEVATPVRPGFMSLEYYRKKHNKPEEETRPTGLVTDHGENWQYFRSTVNPVLMQPKNIRLYTSLVDEVAQDMIKRMKSLRNEKNMLEGDFMIEMNKWSLETIGLVALGGRLNCLDPNLPEDSPAHRLIKCVHDIFHVCNDLDFSPSLWRLFPTKTFKKGMKVYQEHEELAKYFIDKSRKEMLATKKPDEEKGMLEKLLEIDERVANIMACDMLIAGVDTVATLTSTTLYLLAMNQEKQDKLRQEVTSGEDSRKYLKACIKESLRVMPVVTGNMRMSTKEYEIMGYRIPKGTRILTCHQVLSHMESQFPRAKEFIPERWIEDGPLSYKSAHPFAYSPFGFGSRSCVGRRIAELEVETFLTRLLQNFKVEWTGPQPAIKQTTLNYFVGPYGYVFKDV